MDPPPYALPARPATTKLPHMSAAPGTPPAAPAAAAPAGRPARPAPPAPDLAERGGNGQRSDRRLFMQLLAFGNCHDVHPVIHAVQDAKIDGAVYVDATDPYGVAVLAMHEDAAHFTDAFRRLLGDHTFRALAPKPELTMFGRTYTLGYEPDVQETLFTRPRRTATNPDWPWAVWYPLRRSGAFAKLPDDEQRKILMEHGTIGHAFGAADLAHDIRLACFGLDRHDNDFVVALVGRELHPLSAVVQAMRKTTQTSTYIDKLGPFFVGRRVWASAMP